MAQAATPAIPRSKVISRELPRTLAMCAPGARMVVVLVVASTEPDEPISEADDFTIYPVLALVAQQPQRYSRYWDARGRSPQVAPTHKEMIDLGWHFDSTGFSIEYDVVIPHEDYGPCEASFGLDCINGTYEIVVADWDPAEDESRLKDVLTRLRIKAREKAAQYIAEQAAYREKVERDKATAGGDPR